MTPGVELRPMGDGDDRDYVLSSWKNIVVDELEGFMRSRDAAYRLARAGVEDLLHTVRVVVAVSPGEPEVYHGWIARDVDGAVVARVVKPRYHGMGILEMLERAA